MQKYRVSGRLRGFQNGKKVTKKKASGFAGQIANKMIGKPDKRVQAPQLFTRLLVNSFVRVVIKKMTRYAYFFFLEPPCGIL